MPSCAGMGRVMIWRLTLCSRSTIGTTRVNPGLRTSGNSRPRRKTTPRSYCLTTRAAAITYSAPADAVAAPAVTSSSIMTAPRVP